MNVKVKYDRSFGCEHEDFSGQFILEYARHGNYGHDTFEFTIDIFKLIDSILDPKLLESMERCIESRKECLKRRKLYVEEIP